ncbi:hypothetical protein KUTeg_006979 [Tegillarca granosa]|uniref:Uncharacterized protein n=1 Tax=Tegillarca granosa TaxID=220873 RepID=A0ABQ9FBW5_TEGGR|nr:hypothetical protein KUTeg_006979 [Tegillarca granosa]
MFVSSTDGYCTIITFDDEEIGIPYLPKDEILDSPVKTNSKIIEKTSPSSSSVSSKSEEPVSMDTDTCSSDLKLVLETSNDEESNEGSNKTTKENSPKNFSDAIPASTNRGTVPNAVQKKDTSIKDSNQLNEVKQNGSIDEQSNSKIQTPVMSIKSASGQPRRIQITTLSLNKPS